MKNHEEKIVELHVMSLTLNSYTVYENRILMRIIAFCQDDIHDAINQQCKGAKLLTFSRDEVSEQMRHTKIPLRELEPSSTHYSKLRLALQSMASKGIQIPYKVSQKITRYASFPQLFTVEFSPAGRKPPYVILHTKLEVLRYYLSNQTGYHYLDIKTYFQFNHYPTRQMYRLYYTCIAGGQRQLRPEFLAKYLSPQGNYASYTAVKRDLLEVARKEMEQAYQTQQCELHFDYVPLWKDEDKKDIWADRVLFNFQSRRDVELDSSRKAQLDMYQHRVSLKLKLEWNMDQGPANLLCIRIKYTMLAAIDEFFHHQEWFRQKMQNKGTPLTNPGGYMHTKLNALLNKLENNIPYIHT